MFLSLLVKSLNFHLIDGYWVLGQVARDLRFSDIRTLICKRRLLVWLMSKIGVKQTHITFCIDLVNKFTASSISSEDFKLILRLV